MRQICGRRVVLTDHTLIEFCDCKVQISGIWLSYIIVPIVDIETLTGNVIDDCAQGDEYHLKVDTVFNRHQQLRAFGLSLSEACSLGFAE